jgi:ubiquinone/menaquinone biosynthesis C-methylase UbiE
MMKSIERHFSTISDIYRGLRTTDLEPILHIKKELHELPMINAVDIGCGCGRYELKLLQYVGNRLNLLCLDKNKEMLAQTKVYLSRHNIENFNTIISIAENLPILSKSVDCIFTFNAIHHFNLSGFLKETSRVLKYEGILFIYTRSRSQNSHSVWGKYFPLFAEKEKRLSEIDKLKKLIEDFHCLEIKNIQLFKYPRISNLDQLIKQACNHHYSTFSLYHDSDFKKSLKKFKKNLKKNFKDLNNINWIDENVLLVIRKKGSQN